MSNLLVQFGVSNLCVSLLLAIAAYAVHRSGRFPVIAHLLWVLVLVKLVTPPVFTVPVVPVPASSADVGVVESGVGAAEFDLAPSLAPGAQAETSGAAAGSASWSEVARSSLLLLWLSGSAVVFVWSLTRIVRFSGLLTAASQPAPPEIQRLAMRIGGRLGINRTPMIYTTDAHVSPMVWWVGGRVRIVIPSVLPRELGAGQMQWILAHELAHVRRRDHLVRWLEWFACVAFWWNPVAWWARRNLRINEEICCDALVLSRLKPKPRNYAGALMAVVEYLASPALRAPAVASEINSGDVLERRFRMIVASHGIRRTPRWLCAGLLIGTMGLMPLGVAYAQDYDAVERRLAKAVSEGELSLKEAAVMMHALRIYGERDPSRKAAREEYELAVGKVRKAVSDGELTAEEARENFEADRRRLAEAGERPRAGLTERERRAQVGLRIRRAVERGDMSPEEAREKMAAMRREMGAEGEAGPRRISRDEFQRADAEMKKMVESDRASAADARARLDAMRRRMDAPPPAGSGEVRPRIAAILSERGIPREKIRDVMAAMPRIIGEIKVEGDRFELDPRMHRHLEVLGLNGEQIRIVVGLSRRIADRREPEEQQPDRGAPLDWDAIKERIEGAVERGDITREQADKRYQQIKKRMRDDVEPPRQRDRRP